MNRILRVLVLVLMLSSFAFSQSLGEVARQNRQMKRKPATHVYTNDDLPSRDVLPSRTTPDEDAKSSDKDNTKVKEEAEGKDSSDSTDKTDGQKSESEQALQKKWEQYKSRVAEQKSKIDLIQRELDVAKRQNEIQVTEYYADAGSKLRNPQYFSEQMKKYQDTVDEKTKALEEANSALEAMREEGRKADVPSSYLD